MTEIFKFLNPIEVVKLQQLSHSYYNTAVGRIQTRIKIVKVISLAYFHGCNYFKLARINKWSTGCTMKIVDYICEGGPSDVLFAQNDLVQINYNEKIRAMLMKNFF